MLKPLADRVVLKLIEAEETTISGKKNLAKGIKVEVGEKVIFSKFAGTEVKYEDAEYTIVRQDDILAVIE